VSLLGRRTQSPGLSVERDLHFGAAGDSSVSRTGCLSSPPCDKRMRPNAGATSAAESTGSTARTAGPAGKPERARRGTMGRCGTARAARAARAARHRRRRAGDVARVLLETHRQVQFVLLACRISPSAAKTRVCAGHASSQHATRTHPPGRLRRGAGAADGRARAPRGQHAAGASPD